MKDVVLMGNLPLTKEHIVFQSTKDVDDIMAPIKPCGINRFFYLRIFNDMTLVELSNQVDILDFCFLKQKGQGVYATLKHYLCMKSDHIIVSSLEQVSAQTMELRKRFQIGNVMLLKLKSKDFYDFFQFSSTKSLSINC